MKNKRGVESWLMWMIIAIIVLGMLLVLITQKESTVLRPTFVAIENLFKGMRV